MKTLFIIVALSVLTVSGWAQNALFESLTDKFSKKDGFSASQISKDMFDLYLKKRNIEENSPVYEALKNLDNILVVSQTSQAEWRKSKTEPAEMNSDVNDIHQAMINHYTRNKYTLFKTEKQMGEDVKVFLKKNSEIVAALAVVTNSGWAANLIELQGNIDLSTVSQLNQVLNLRGLENLYKINNTSFLGVPVPPTPMTEEHIQEMMEKHREIIEKQQFLTEKQRKEIETRAFEMAEKQRALSEKHKELAEKYGRQPIFLSNPGDNTIFYIDGKEADAEEVKALSPDTIESVEVNKDPKSAGNSTIRITTRKK